MDFQLRQVIGRPPGEVVDLLTDEAFVAATGALAPLADCRLLAATREGSRVEVRIHRRFAADLPRVVTAVVDPARLTWVEEVTFEREAGTGHHRVLPDHYPDLLRCTFTTALAPDGGGTVRTVTGSLRVKVLLGGRQVERAIVDGLTTYADAEAALLDAWPGGDPTRPEGPIPADPPPPR